MNKSRGSRSPNDDDNGYEVESYLDKLVNRSGNNVRVEDIELASI